MGSGVDGLMRGSKWPDAKSEVTGEKCDARQQLREKREESREKQEVAPNRPSGVDGLMQSSKGEVGGTIAKPSGLRGDNSETERPSGGQ